MKNIAMDVLLTLGLAFGCCWFFGLPIIPMIKEMIMFYLVMAVVAVFIFTYIGYALTKAMNPQTKDKDLNI